MRFTYTQGLIRFSNCAGIPEFCKPWLGQYNQSCRLSQNILYFMNWWEETKQPCSVFSYNTCNNCHNIYWYLLIWLVKNGHLIVLSCISFLNELPFVFTRGGDIHFLFWYCAMILWREMNSRQLLTLYISLTWLTCSHLQVEKRNLTNIRRFKT